MSRLTKPSSEKVFAADDTSVADHKIGDRRVVPFAAWIAWARELIIPPTADQTREFTDLLVRRPVSIDECSAQSVRFLLEDDANCGRFHVIPASLDHSDADTIVEGRWGVSRAEEERLSAPWTSMAWNAAEFYDAAHRRGLAYGPSYQRVEHFEFGTEGWRAEISLLNANADPDQRWLTALDAMLQGGAVLATNEATAWIPYRIDLARLAEHDNFADSSDGVIVGRWLTVNENERVAHVDWIDPQSRQVVAQFRGIHYRNASLQQVTSPAKASASMGGSLTLECGAPQSLLNRLRMADVAARKEILACAIEEFVLELLKWDESRRKDLSRGFVAIGLDSLLAVDLQFRLQTELKFSLPPGTGLNQPTIADLADFLLSQHPDFVRDELNPGVQVESLP